MSHIEYYTRAVMSDRLREAETARRRRVARRRTRWTRSGRLSRPRLRLA